MNRCAILIDFILYTVAGHLQLGEEPSSFLKCLGVELHGPWSEHICVVTLEFVFNISNVR